jgi:hypothetical protein
MSSSSMNKFQVFNEDATSKNQAPIVYDERGNIDIGASLPDYADLSTAMERGESWYDIMYPRGENITVDNSGWEKIGTKRKRAIVDISKTLKIVKKPRRD